MHLVFLVDEEACVCVVLFLISPSPFSFPNKHCPAQKDTSDAALSTQYMDIPVHNRDPILITTFSLSKDANAHAEMGHTLAEVMTSSLSGTPARFSTWRHPRGGGMCSVLHSPIKRGAFLFPMCFFVFHSKRRCRRPRRGRCVFACRFRTLRGRFLARLPFSP